MIDADLAEVARRDAGRCLPLEPEGADPGLFVASA